MIISIVCLIFVLNFGDRIFMKKVLLLLFLALWAILPVSAQKPIVLPQLGVKDKSIERVLIGVSNYIRMKPQGLRFPVTKIIFKKVKGGLTYEIEGIDNTWAELFNYGEATYGYAVVAKRLYVIMGLTDEELDINHLFYVAGGSKTFSRNRLPPTGLVRRPKWIFDYINGESIKIGESDLDILER